MKRVWSLLLSTAARDPVLTAPLAKLALSDGSLRSLRCSPGAAVFVESDETTVLEMQLGSRGCFLGFSCRSTARTSLTRIAR
jgi:hypothetical protein